MTTTNAYTTLETVKSRLNITDTDDDTSLEAVIDSVSRWIDGHKVLQNMRGTTQFFAISETRYFTAYQFDKLHVDDLQSIVTLKTDDDGDGTYETTWSTTDYNLWPYNAGDAPPYEQIEVSFNGDEIFTPGIPRSVEIDGVWGYNSGTDTSGFITNAPQVIQEACILGVMMYWKRKDNIYGVGGNSALGLQRLKHTLSEDKDIMAMIQAIEPRQVS